MGALNREGLRQKYNIVEDPGKDFMIDSCIHCWAHPCALCQERRELDYHRNDIESMTQINRNLIEPRNPVQSSQPVYVVLASNVPNQPIVINGTLPNINNDEENGPTIQVINKD